MQNGLWSASFVCMCPDSTCKWIYIYTSNIFISRQKQGPQKYCKPNCKNKIKKKFKKITNNNNSSFVFMAVWERAEEMWRPLLDVSCDERVPHRFQRLPVIGIFLSITRGNNWECCPGPCEKGGPPKKLGVPGPNGI